MRKESDMAALNFVMDKIGLNLYDCVVEPFRNIYIDPLDKEFLRAMTLAYPRPGNAQSLKVPKLNTWLYDKTTLMQIERDQDMQRVQSYMIASMSAIAMQAQTLIDLKKWAMHSIDPDISAEVFENLYDSLMDANLILTRAMYDTNQLRREIIKQGMADSLTALIDANSCTPEWMVGETNKVDNPVIKQEAIEDKLDAMPENDELSISTPYPNILECIERSNIKFEDGPTELEPPDGLALHSPADVKSCENTIIPDPSPQENNVQAYSKPYLCTECGKGFQHNSDLKVHTRIHTGEKPFVCSTCGKAFAQSGNLNAHLKRYHVGNPHACTLCSETFTELDGLKAHQVSHSQRYENEELNVKSEEYTVCVSKSIHTVTLIESVNDSMDSNKVCYVCSYCCKPFKHASSLKEHIRNHTGNKPFSCEVCNKTFTHANTLKEHMNIHTGTKPFVCLDCGKAYTHSTLLRRHKKDHHHTRESVEEKPLSCSNCVMGFTSSADLTYHMMSHEGDRPHSFKLCNETFMQKNQLTKHMTVHTDLKPYVCSDCGMDFAGSSLLKKHLKVHIGEGPHLGNICGKCFSVSNSLKSHTCSRTGIKRFGCPVCRKAFAERMQLTIHMRRHLGERPYLCTDCGKRFTTSGSLRIHNRIHTGEIVHQCGQCPKRFYVAAAFRNHMRCHMGEKPYTCDVCGACCVKMLHLRLHQRRHRQNKWYNCLHCHKGFNVPSHLREHEMTHTDERRHKCSHCGVGFIKAFRLKIHMMSHSRNKINYKNSKIRSKNTNEKPMCRITSNPIEVTDSSYVDTKAHVESYLDAKTY